MSNILANEVGKRTYYLQLMGKCIIYYLYSSLEPYIAFYSKYTKLDMVKIPQWVKAFGSKLDGLNWITIFHTVKEDNYCKLSLSSIHDVPVECVY